MKKNNRWDVEKTLENIEKSNQLSIKDKMLIAACVAIARYKVNEE